VGDWGAASVWPERGLQGTQEHRGGREGAGWKKVVAAPREEEEQASAGWSPNMRAR
jgi:hypothetical protein